MNYYSFTKKVTEDHLDEFKHVNNVVYVSFIQEAADKHWQLLVAKQPDFAYIWFIVRHEIDYKQQAFLGDELTIKTWVGETKGIKSVRHVEILKGETLLVKCQTTYCMLTKDTRKPTRITDDVLKILEA